MTRNRWKLLSGIALAFSIQGTCAGEAWLAITSDPPGAAISVDNVYRGTTPQRPEDTLRIRVSEGVREIHARKQAGGKEYAAKQTVDAMSDQEILVQFNLRKKTAATSVNPTVPPVQASKLRYGAVFPLGDLEVPGRNF